MKHGFAFKARRKADIHHLGVAVEQQRGGMVHPLAPKPLGRRQMGVFAKQRAQLGQADAGAFCQCRRVGEIRRIAAHPRHQAFEQGDILVFAAIEQIGPATLAGAQPRRPAFRFRAVEGDIFLLGRMGRTGRQAIDSRRAHADKELSVELAAAGFLAGPGKGFG